MLSNSRSSSSRRCAPLPALGFAIAIGLGATEILAQSSPTSDWQSLWNGRDLQGWTGDPQYWSVEDGKLVGRSTADRPLKANTFLVHDITVRDFELRLRYRIRSGSGNSGVQYRSQPRPGFSMWGYQADIEFGPTHTGMLYEEGGRGIMARRGQQVVIGADGKGRVTGKLGEAGSLQLEVHTDGETWNQYRIVARGNRLQHFINGAPMVDVIDLGAQAAREGRIGLQVHRGPPMEIQFDSIEYRPLAAPEEPPSTPTKKAKPTEKLPSPQWIWATPSASDGQRVWLHKSFQLANKPSSGRLLITVDNRFVAWINGQRVGQSSAWEQPRSFDVGRHLRVGTNAIAVRAENDGSIAGLLARLDYQVDGRSQRIVSDASWRGSITRPNGFRDPGFDASSWANAHRIPPQTAAVWASALRGSAFGRPTNTGPVVRAPADITPTSGFRVDHIYGAKPSEGSFVALTFDGQGRAIVSSQYGGLYRITLAAEANQEPTIEALDVPIRGAQGLLVAHGCLYVNASIGGSVRGPGLYRLRDLDGDDQFESVEQLFAWTGAGEHGSHALLHGPDDAIWLVNGNYVAPPKTDLASRVRAPREDLLLARESDPFGHARDKYMPAGCIYRLDPDTLQMTRIAAGMRNTYDIAFAPNGELFGYDADMEWDVGMPWYRQTRINHIVSGADYGWRNGSGKRPNSSYDTWPPAAELGGGSPTGLIFGTGTNFPQKYRDALFACDWARGRIVAVELNRQGSTYVGTSHDIVTGRPLNVTDIARGPDGSLYFTTGGRRTQSDLYRLRHVDAKPSRSESTRWTGAAELTARHAIEQGHRSNGSRPTVDALWPNLGSADRFMRNAARLALEYRPATEWRQRALTERDPRRALESLLALARVTDAVADRVAITTTWLRLANTIEATPEPSKLDLLRDAGRLLAMVLHRGDPFPPSRSNAKAKGDKNRTQPAAMAKTPDAVRRARVAWLPAATRDAIETAVVKHLQQLTRAGTPDFWPADAHAEFLELAVWFERPEAISAAFAGAELQEDVVARIRCLFPLRHARTGWTKASRERLFDELSTVRTVGRGGRSFSRYVDTIARGALHGLDKARRKQLEERGRQKARPTPVAKPSPGPRAVTKLWTRDELTKLVTALDPAKRDPKAGQRAFAAAQCARCHAFGSAAATGGFGPELTTVSSRLGRADLLTAILTPTANVSDQYQHTILTLKDGSVIVGRITRRTATEVEVLVGAFGETRRVVEPGTIASEIASPVSPMPAGLLNTLSRDEVLDLFGYLLTPPK